MAFADRLEAGLKAHGFTPLIDRSEIYAFEDWWKRVQALIGKADTIIFVLSPESVSSDICRKEVAFAASLNKRFAPIVCRRVDDRAVPEALAKLNFIFFDDQTQFDEQTDRLVAALQSDIGWIRKHTEFGEAARRWRIEGRSQGLLLRSPVLEEAERWIASRPAGAPLPTEETQTFIAQSRKAATRRRSVLTASLGAGLAVALALASLAGWQWRVAGAQRDRAEERLNVVSQLMTAVTRRIANMAGFANWKAAALLKDAESITAGLSAETDDPRIVLGRVAALREFAQAYFTMSDPDAARSSLKRATEMLSVLEDHGGDRASTDSYAMLRSEINGDTKRYDTSPSLSNFDQAIADYNEALKKQSNSPTSSLRLWRKIADAELRASDMAAAAIKADYLSRSKEALIRAEAAWSANTERTNEVVREAALVKSLSGDLHSRVNDFSSAEEGYTSAIADLRGILQSEAFDEEVSLFVGESYRKLGDAQRLVHKYAEAAQSYQFALNYLQQVLDSSPGHIGAQRSLNLLNYGVRRLRKESAGLPTSRPIHRIGEGLDELFGMGVGPFQFGMSLSEVNGVLGEPFSERDLGDLPLAIEYEEGQVHYLWRWLKDTHELDYFHENVPCLIAKGYVTFLFKEGRLFEISVRFLSGNDCPEQRGLMAKLAGRFFIPMVSNPAEQRFRYDGRLVSAIGMTNSYAVSINFVGK
jgi:tetratricopeptide (TPR) repeat protein